MAKIWLEAELYRNKGRLMFQKKKITEVKNIVKEANLAFFKILNIH